MRSAARLRWAAFAVFTLSNVLNYLDRGILATVWPSIRSEFHLDEVQYGFLISALSFSYAFSAPITGYLLDWLGLNRGISIAVAVWSAAASATALTRNFVALFWTRAGMGAGESAGIPAVGKANAMYLEPKERAVGAAVSQVGITVGATLASFAAWAASFYGWRFPFALAGFAGFLWIPLWLSCSRRIRPSYPPQPHRAAPLKRLLVDPRLLSLVIANVLWMGIYSLWTNWTSLYLFNVHHMAMVQAAKLSWIPPMVSNLGGLLGGWLSLRSIERGMPAVPARLRVILIAALGGLITLAVPLTPTPVWSIAAISMSYFWATAGSVNLYTIPLDLYGPERAGFAISALVFAYGLLQTVISPVIGGLVKTRGFTPVCWMVALPPLAGYALLSLVNTRLPAPKPLTTA